MPNFAFLLEYDGARFSGWQRQRHGVPTAQGSLETALSTLAQTPTSCIGAGRTDAGVHALGQVASGHCAIDLDAGELWRALNSILPDAVAVRALARVDDSFHALRDATGKRYVYRLWTGPTRSPLRGARYAPAPPLEQIDLAAIREAASHFVGAHDFASLQAAGSSAATTHRTLERVELREHGDGGISVDVVGDGFLRHMVRNLVGTLLEVGARRRTPASIPALLGARDRTRAGPTAPACGLTLVEVRYDPAVAWEVGESTTFEAATGWHLLP